MSSGEDDKAAHEGDYDDGVGLSDDDEDASSTKGQSKNIFGQSPNRDYQEPCSPDVKDGSFVHTSVDQKENDSPLGVAASTSEEEVKLQEKPAISNKKMVTPGELNDSIEV